MAILLLPAVVDAALWVRVTVEPIQPVAGEPARVSVQTLVLTGASCLADPLATVVPVVAFDGAPYLETMELEAVGPGQAEALTVEVRRRNDDPTFWDGKVVFPTAGAWTLRMVAPSWPGDPTGECSGAAVTVHVLPHIPPSVACMGSRPWWDIVCRA
jgi:hypothetical protein